MLGDGWPAITLVHLPFLLCRNLYKYPFCVRCRNMICSALWIGEDGSGAAPLYQHQEDGGIAAHVSLLSFFFFFPKNSKIPLLVTNITLPNVVTLSLPS